MHFGWYKLLFSQWVTSHWPIVLAAWLSAAVVLHAISPAWEEIAADGDLAYLPSTVASAQGLRALEEAFPGANARSQLVVVFAREEDQLSADDLALAFDFTRRLHWIAGKLAWESRESLRATSGTRSVSASLLDAEPVAKRTGRVESTSGTPDSGQKATRPQENWTVLTEIAQENLSEAIGLDQALADYSARRSKSDAAAHSQNVDFPRLPAAYELRGRLLRELGQAEEAAIDLRTAQLIREQNTDFLPPDVPEWSENLRDVWSWRNPVVGHKLGADNPRARLISLQLQSEFTATSNIQFVSGIEQLANRLRAQHARSSPGLRIEIAGSAAVGADMLRASDSGMRKTEMVTVILVLAILATVYRSPFLVAIPLTSIALSLIVATSVVALFARDPANPQSFGLGVFTTTRIFVVVLLFGAGTDFCLFFLARNRELLQTRKVESRKQMHRLIASSWRSVYGALLASATTTIVGLALMYFSGFEKFKYSGPVIAVSLAITLLVCLTFTPALLSALGKLAFWPIVGSSSSRPASRFSLLPRVRGQSQRYWASLAESIVSFPMLALGVTLAVLLVPAALGVIYGGRVTYDLTEELSDTAPSRRGAQLINEFFPTRDASPVSILVKRESPFDSEEDLRAACSTLAASLYTNGVDSVRCLTDPLGDYPPGKRMGLFARDAWRRRLLLAHRITRERYLSSVSLLTKRVARFDVVLTANPFTPAASETLDRLKEVIQREMQRSQSPWSEAEFTLSGTTVGITDLRAVTQADQRRIQTLVTLGVWFVLVLLLRKPLLSTYLIITVLLSYFATLGITYWVFAAIHGPEYSGLDWKVPLFLFVILVAVGQDYNVYLVTRIFQERRSADWNHAVSQALKMTGGIITSCGFVMAGTFIAMTSPAVWQWLGTVLPEGWISTQAPVLRGLTELGFALALGVMLDTLVVRSILVPSFVILIHRQDGDSVSRVAAEAGS